jgi:putative phage-type endonuclease
MKIIDLTQRSDAWLQWRSCGIAASEAAVILGESPYKTPWRLWAEKTGLVAPVDLSGNPNVQRGIRLEPVARSAYERKHQTLLLPLCAEADHNPLLRASFDGINDNGEPVELKCPTEAVFKEVDAQHRNSAAYQLYWPQVMHQINVAGSKRGFLVFFYDDQLIEFEIRRDAAFIKYLEQQELAFWNRVVHLLEPVKDPDRDIFKPTPGQRALWTDLATRYKRTRSVVQTLEAQLQRHKQDVVACQTELVRLMGDFAHAEYAGLKVTRFLNRGAIDYNQLIQDHVPALDEQTKDLYRKPSQERIRISVTDPIATPLSPEPASCTDTDQSISALAPGSFYF